MSDFFHPSTTQVARKSYQCVYCGDLIEAAERYTKQTGVWDGAYYTSRFHPECFDDLCEQGDGEFSPYSNERPVAA